MTIQASPAAGSIMKRKPRVVAVSSPGGHWEQLTSIQGAFFDTDVTYVTTSPSLASSLPGAKFRIVSDCNRDQPIKLIRCCYETFVIIHSLRPDVVVTTGAAPGLFAIAAGRLLGSRTIWVDSLANTERLSLSGRIAMRIASLTLTQWKHLSRPNGPHYYGEIL